MQELLQNVWLCLPSQGVLARLVPLVLLLTLAGLPVLCLAGENLALLRRRVSYGHCARQLACCGVVCGVLALLACAGALVWDILARQPEPAVQWQHLASITLTTPEQGAVLVCLSLLAGVCLLALYATLWPRPRNFPVLHQVPGLLAALLCLATLYGQLCLLGVRAGVPAGAPSAPQTLAGLFLPAPEAGLWGWLPCALPLCLSLAGAVGALWLLARRNRDDYGRDHYRQMLPWCGLWARNAWVVVWLIIVGLAGLKVWQVRFDTGYLPLLDIARATGQVLLWGLPALLWAIVCRSQTPLRHKLCMVLALLLMCVCAVLYFTPLLAPAKPA